MRTFVLTHEDLESEDVDTILLDQWANEGYVKVHRLVAHLPFYETETAISTVADTRSYAHGLKRVETALGPDGLLTYVGHQEAQRRWLKTGQPSTGQPTMWSVRQNDGEIHLWPTPDDAYDVTLFGIRTPTTWPTSSGSSPDLPTDFHQIILSWMLHRVMLHQDDGDRAEAELTHFNNLLGELVTDEVRADMAQPFILGGSRPRRGGPLPQSMPYDDAWVF